MHDDSWQESAPETAVDKAAAVLFPIIHPQAAYDLAHPEEGGIAEWDQTHIRAAEALADAGLLLPGDAEVTTEYGVRRNGRLGVVTHGVAAQIARYVDLDETEELVQRTTICSTGRGRDGDR